MDLPVPDVSGRGAVSQYVPATPPLPAVAPSPANERSASNGQQFGDPQRKPPESGAASKALLTSDTLDVLRRLTQESGERRGPESARAGAYVAGQRKKARSDTIEISATLPGRVSRSDGGQEKGGANQSIIATAPFEALRRANFAYGQAQQSAPSYPHAQKAEVLDFVA